MAPVNRIDETPNDRIARLEKRVDELTRTIGRTSTGLRDVDRIPVVALDPITGQGLSRPYLPIPFAMTQYTSAPRTNTLVPVMLWRAVFPKQHPAFRIRVSSIADTAVTGIYQLWVNNGQVGADYPIAADPTGFMTANDIGPVPVPGNTMDNVLIELRAGVTAGVGLVYATVDYAYGCELSI